MSDLAATSLGRAVELVSARSKRLFDPPEWKRVLRIAAFNAGQAWIDSFLARRWDEGYARRLGYSAKGGRDGLPFYEKGRWIRQAGLARPRVSVNANGVALRIVVPVGHPLQPMVSRAFRTTTDEEHAFVANAFLASVKQVINRGVSTQVRSKIGGGGTMRRWTRRLGASDRAMSRAITAKGFRAPGGASLQRTASQLQATSKANRKQRLSPWALKQKHRAWHRTAGGAAGPTASQIASGQTMSQTYAGSRMQRHAEAQRRYRDRYRSTQATLRESDRVFSRLTQGI